MPYIAENNPVDLEWIHTQQNIGAEPVTKVTKYPEWYFNKLNDGYVIAYHVLSIEDCLTQWKIALAIEMAIPLIKWYHSILVHPGSKRSRMTIQARSYHPDIRKHVDGFHCNYCQCMKIHGKGMGLLPDCDLTITLWYEVAGDLIGPCSAKTELFNGEFYALSCIDTTTNLVELVCIDIKSSDVIASKFEIGTSFSWQ